MNFYTKNVEVNCNYYDWITFEYWKRSNIQNMYVSHQISSDNIQDTADWRSHKLTFSPACLRSSFNRASNSVTASRSVMEIHELFMAEPMLTHCLFDPPKQISKFFSQENTIACNHCSDIFFSNNSSWCREREREREILSLSAFWGTEDIGVHIVHISRVIITYTLEWLSSLT